jgi:hypothetical protein
MAKPNVPLLAFNRGEIGKHALGRIDIDELRLAAQRQVNWMPLAVGPMMLRPGTSTWAARRATRRRASSRSCSAPATLPSWS